MTTHLALPPDAAFWLDELRLAHFDDALALLDDPGALRAALADEFTGPATTRALDAFLADRDPVATRAHALLVGWFLRQKKSAAVADVAAAALPSDTVAAWRAPSGRLLRLPAALRLYEADPLHLLDVDVCHRWHTRRRCALELTGPKRALPDVDPETGWAAFAAAAQAHLEAEVPKLRGRLRFRRVTFRRHRDDVLLAWSVPAERDTVRQSAGRVVAGHHDDWTILRVHRGGNRVDVTATNLTHGRHLADGLAKAVWGQGRYRMARDPLTSDSVNELLRRMRAPDDDVFRLLEITGEVPGLPDRPLFTIGNAGQARVEAAVEEVRRHMAFAERWQTVLRVKLAFGEAWRIEVHFPPPDGELLLSYSDGDRDKEVAAAFEALVRDELGVEIHPKATPARRRERKEPVEPSKPGPSTWLRLLGPVLDDPAAWEVRLVRELAERGVVRVTEHTTFRCGDGPVLGRHRDCLDCPGEIEMPYGEVDPNDPYRQEDDAEHVCGTCGTAWSPGRYRLPVTRRLRVRPEVEGAWRYIQALLGDEAPFREEGPGLLGGVVRGQRAQVVFAPLADPSLLAPDVAALFPTCWVSMPGDPRLLPLGPRGVDLSEVLAEGRLVLQRALELGRAGSLAPGAMLLLAAPPPSPYGATPREPAPPTPITAPTRRFLSLDDKGVWLDGKPVAAAKAGGTRLLIALLNETATQDDAAGRPRRFRTAEQMVRQSSGGTFTYSDVQNWVSRTRRALREKFKDLPGLDTRIIEGGDGEGYRLGEGFLCHGFDLTAELRNRQP
jgi:hypothetical protein